MTVANCPHSPKGELVGDKLRDVYIGLIRINSVNLYAVAIFSNMLNAETFQKTCLKYTEPTETNLDLLENEHLSRI